MLYTPEQIRKIINNSVTSAGLDNAVINGRPVGVLDEYRDFTQYGNTLLQPLVANTFINALYNQFIYRATSENFFTSPFDRFRERREGVGYGEYEVDVQPIMPIPYDMKAFDRILDFWETPVVVQYFAINRRDVFPQTIVKQMMKDAFISYEHFDNFLSKLILAPRKGNVITETNAVKMVINHNVASGAVKTKVLPDKGDYDSADDYYKALASEIVGIASAMTAEPTTEFNNYSAIEGTNGQEVWAQSDRRDLVLMGNAELIAKLRTYVLAFAMHNEEIDFNFTFINLNTFNYKIYDSETREFDNEVESPIQLVLCDGGWLKLEDNLDEDFSNTNAMTMGVQRALQVQQTIAIRAYRNAVVWLSEGTTEMFKFDTDTAVFYPLTQTSNTQNIKVKGVPPYTGNLKNVTHEAAATIGQLGAEQTELEIPDTLPYEFNYHSQSSSVYFAPNMSSEFYQSENDGDYITITVEVKGQKISFVIPAVYTPAENNG